MEVKIKDKNLSMSFNSDSETVVFSIGDELSKEITKEEAEELLGQFIFILENF